jgi:hypothetical protein
MQSRRVRLIALMTLWIMFLVVGWIVFEPVQIQINV